MVSKRTVAILAGVGIGVPGILYLASRVTGMGGNPVLNKARSCELVGTPHPLARPGYIWENLVIVACDANVGAAIYGWLDAKGNIDPRSPWVLHVWRPLGNYGTWYGNIDIETYPPGETDMSKVLNQFNNQVQTVLSAHVPKALVDPLQAWMNKVAPLVAAAAVAKPTS